MHKTRTDAAGWILLEAVLLGVIVLGVVAALGIFARTALLREHNTARAEAALIARAQLSVMEAELDRGIPPLRASTAVTSNDRIYQVEAFVARQSEFYDVGLRLSWQILGREAQVDFVRRMRRHVSVENAP